MERSVGFIQLAGERGSFVFLQFLRSQVPCAALNAFFFTLTLCKTMVQIPSKGAEYYGYKNVYTL